MRDSGPGSGKVVHTKGTGLQQELDFTKKSQRTGTSGAGAEEVATGNRQCRAHGLQNARISCREINVRSRAYPLAWSTSGVRGTLFLSFVAVPMGFAIKAYLGDVFCGYLDPEVPMGTHVMSSSISGLS